jgi:hypothetical protein
MGYFDALTSSAFKTGTDGRRLFFPWGVLGSGYVLASEHDYERLQRQIKIYLIVAMVLIIAAIMLKPYAGIAVTAFLMAGYAAWARNKVRGLQPSDEGLSLDESMTSQGLAHSAGFLWAAVIGSLLFVAAGVLLLVFDPDEWLTALATIVFFALCGASIGRMLVLRRRGAAR